MPAIGALVTHGATVQFMLEGNRLGTVSGARGPAVSISSAPYQSSLATS